MGNNGVRQQFSIVFSLLAQAFLKAHNTPRAQSFSLLVSTLFPPATAEEPTLDGDFILLESDTGRHLAGEFPRLFGGWECGGICPAFVQTPLISPGR